MSKSNGFGFAVAAGRPVDFDQQFYQAPYFRIPQWVSERLPPSQAVLLCFLLNHAAMVDRKHGGDRDAFKVSCDTLTKRLRLSVDRQMTLLHKLDRRGYLRFSSTRGRRLAQGHWCIRIQYQRLIDAAPSV